MPYCCNPLTVAESSKLRLVLDLRHVNKYLEKQPFKYENLGTVKKIFEKDYYFCCFDLKSGYHHISVNSKCWKYLGFSWTYESGCTLYFVFVVAPFGLSTASYLFTKMVRPLVKKWRGEGIRCVVYLDDGIFGSIRHKITAMQSAIVKNDLLQAGFTINEEKSILQPVQRAVWLGFIIDTTNFTFSVTEEKILKLHEKIEFTLSEKTVSARVVAKIAGNIISMGPGIGPLTRLLTRKMYSFIDQADTWDGRQRIDEGTYNELVFWHKNLNSSNGYKIKGSHAITKVVYSDASAHSYGGYVVQELGSKIAHGTFNQEERSKSSTHRELAAVKYVLQSFVHLIRHQVVLWHSDNANVAKIITNGSSKDSLQHLALQIFSICMNHDIQIVSKWIPREENDLADTISKYVDTDNWGIDLETFDFIQEEFGIFTFDRFADAGNAKVSRFDSRFHCEGAENVNTFTSHWGNHFNWLCPPINLIGETIHHAKLCKSKGILLVPEWKSSYFWPLLTPDGEKFYAFVKEYRVLDPFFINENLERTVFTGFAKFRTLALLIDFQE